MPTVTMPFSSDHGAALPPVTTTLRKKSPLCRSDFVYCSRFSGVSMRNADWT